MRVDVHYNLYILDLVIRFNGTYKCLPATCNCQNEKAASIEEVREAMNEMKSGKSPGLDGFPV